MDLLTRKHVTPQVVLSYMPERGFDILLEDDALLGVVKPSGVATQAPPGIDSLERRIKEYLSRPELPAAEVYLGIPHRLDRPVSGAMVFAKTHRVARNLARQFERRRVRKIYRACVEGIVDPADGMWTDHLSKVYGQPRAMVVNSTHPGAQQAVLRYRTIGRHPHGSWLEIELETGRTHQVRVQAASRGHAILGDAHYGSRIPFGEQFDDERLRPIALHARSLTLLHTITRQEIALVAPLPECWGDVPLDDGFGR